MSIAKTIAVIEHERALAEAEAETLRQKVRDLHADAVREHIAESLLDGLRIALQKIADLPQSQTSGDLNFARMIAGDALQTISAALQQEER